MPDDPIMTETEAGESSASVSHELTFGGELSGHRLDFAVSRELGVSRTYAASLIKCGRVESADGRRVKPSIKPEDGAVFTIDVPPPERLDLEPEDVPFTVVYDDADIIVVDKPAGIVVHPAPGHWRGTLVHGLLYRYPELGNMNGVERPGIVHRLDATTSGLMAVARSGLAHERLSADLRSRRFEKRYLALVHGVPKKNEFSVDLPIGRDPSSRVKMAVVEQGRDALTDLRVRARYASSALIECRIHTGRTHQIRVHLAALGHPLVGDELYAPRRGTPFDPPRVFLHSWKMGFAHPRTGEQMRFRRTLPPELVSVLERSRGRTEDP